MFVQSAAGILREIPTRYEGTKALLQGLFHCMPQPFMNHPTQEREGFNGLFQAQ